MKEFQPARAAILYQLRHVKAARFSELMKPTHLESDVFKFHIRALKDQGFIVKDTDGYYELTATGKEQANNLNQSGLQSLRQPKISVLIVATQTNAAGDIEYLVQQRKRQPFYGYWGCISGPAQWGEDFEVTAQAELAKQCGITDANCLVVSFCRQQDYLDDTILLEDKMFVIIRATIASALPDVWHWPGGATQWMSVTQLKAQPKVFSNSWNVIKRLDAKQSFAAFFKHTSQYTAPEY